MINKNLKKSLEHLPVMKEDLVGNQFQPSYMNKRYNFRENPIEIIELAFIVQTTSPTTGCYPFKQGDVAAVVGFGPGKSTVVYCKDTLLGEDGKTYAAGSFLGKGPFHSMSIDQIESYEILKQFVVNKHYKY